MDTLLTFLELAKNKVIDKIFWPSSIGVFGPDTPKDNTPRKYNSNSFYGLWYLLIYRENIGANGTNKMINM